MALAETVRSALESLKIWEETHLADVHRELAHLAGRVSAASEPAAEEPAAEPAAAEAPRDAGGKFTAAEPAGKA